MLGNWGSGKTTVMSLIKDRLGQRHPGRFDFAWFNAWEYEHTDNKPAALAQEVVHGLTDVKGFWRKERLKLGFAWKEHGRELRQMLMLLVGLVALAMVLFTAALPLLLDTVHLWQELLFSLTAEHRNRLLAGLQDETVRRGLSPRELRVVARAATSFEALYGAGATAAAARFDPRQAGEAGVYGRVYRFAEALALPGEGAGTLPHESGR